MINQGLPPCKNFGGATPPPPNVLGATYGDYTFSVTLGQIFVFQFMLRTDGIQTEPLNWVQSNYTGLLLGKLEQVPCAYRHAYYSNINHLAGNGR